MLIAPDSAGGSLATCPRCLAAVPIPETPREPDAVQAERPRRAESGMACPRCGRAVEAIWVSCPWCEEPLRGRGDGRHGRPDLDVRRDTKRTSGVLIALAVVVGLGVAFAAWQAFTLTDKQADQRLLYTVGLLFLAGLSTLFVYLRFVYPRSGGNPGAGGVRRVVGAFAVAGVLTLLSACLGLALVVYIVAVCNNLFH